MGDSVNQKFIENLQLKLFDIDATLQFKCHVYETEELWKKAIIDFRDELIQELNSFKQPNKYILAGFAHEVDKDKGHEIFLNRDESSELIETCESILSTSGSEGIQMLIENKLPESMAIFIAIKHYNWICDNSKWAEFSATSEPTKENSKILMDGKTLNLAERFYLLDQLTSIAEIIGKTNNSFESKNQILAHILGTSEYNARQLRNGKYNATIRKDVIDSFLIE